MAVLDPSEKIGIYTVQNLIKANRYTETYRIVDGDDHPFFLKVFLLGNIPTKLINQEKTGILQRILPIEEEVLKRGKPVIETMRKGKKSGLQQLSEYYDWVDTYVKEVYP